MTINCLSCSLILFPVTYLLLLPRLLHHESAAFWKLKSCNAVGLFTYWLVCVCVKENAQLVHDVSVFVLRRNASWRRFAVDATRCIPSCLCFSLTRHGSWRSGKTGLRALTLQPNMLSVPESGAKRTISRFSTQGPAETNPAGRSDVTIAVSYCFLCQRPPIQSLSEWLAAPWCKRHLVLVHELGRRWGSPAKVESFARKSLT